MKNQPPKETSPQETSQQETAPKKTPRQVSSRQGHSRKENNRRANTRGEKSRLPPALAAIRAQVARVAAHESRPALWRPLPNTGFAPLLWEEGAARVQRGAACLTDLGFRAGGRVLVVAEGDWPVAVLAAMCAGGEVALAPAGEEGASLRQRAKACGARWVVASEASLEALHGEKRSARAPRGVAVEAMLEGEGGGAVALEEGFSPVAAWLPATGGTSADRKGGPTGWSLTHEALWGLCERFGRLFAMGPEDHVLSILPVTAPAMLSAGLVAPLMAGATLHLDPGAPFDSRQLTVFRPTVLIATRRQWQQLGGRIEAQLAAGTRGVWARRLALKRHELQTAMKPVPPTMEAKYRLARELSIAPLKRLFGLGRARLGIVVDEEGPIDARLIESFAAVDLPLHSVTGPAAAFGLAFANAPGSSRTGTLGRPFPGLEALVDDAGALWLRGATLAAEALDSEGRLGALDRGSIDWDGFVHAG